MKLLDLTHNHTKGVIGSTFINETLSTNQWVADVKGRDLHVAFDLLNQTLNNMTALTETTI